MSSFAGGRLVVVGPPGRTHQLGDGVAISDKQLVVDGVSYDLDTDVDDLPEPVRQRIEDLSKRFEQQGAVEQPCYPPELTACCDELRLPQPEAQLALENKEFRRVLPFSKIKKLPLADFLVVAQKMKEAVDGNDDWTTAKAVFKLANKNYKLYMVPCHLRIEDVQVTGSGGKMYNDMWFLMDGRKWIVPDLGDSLRFIGHRTAGADFRNLPDEEKFLSAIATCKSDVMHPSKDARGELARMERMQQDEATRRSELFNSKSREIHEEVARIAGKKRR